MRRTATSRTAAVSTLAFWFAASIAASAGWFPIRPTGATVSSVKGVLQDYGVGQAAGTVTIKTADGKELNFRVGANLTIDGVVVECNTTPRPWYKPPPEECPVWPSYIRFGSTVTRVYFWNTVEPGSGLRVKVTDRLTTR